jgi:hypothetical protein
VHATIEYPFLGNGTVNTVFSMGCVPRLYNDSLFVTRVEAGSNTSTVTVQVVGGDEKGSLKSETVKYGRKSLGITTEKDCAGKGQ